MFFKKKERCFRVDGRLPSLSFFLRKRGKKKKRVACSKTKKVQKKPRTRQSVAVSCAISKSNGTTAELLAPPFYPFFFLRKKKGKRDNGYNGSAFFFFFSNSNGRSVPGFSHLPVKRSFDYNPPPLSLPNTYIYVYIYVLGLWGIAMLLHLQRLQ